MRHDGCLRRSGSLRRRAEPYGSEGWGFESLRARHPVTVRVVPLTCGFVVWRVLLRPSYEDLGVTFANKSANGARVDRVRTPRGHIRRRGSRCEIAVPVGRDPITKRYRYTYDYANTQEQAERRRLALIEQIAKGRAPLTRGTVNDLIDRWLGVAELELTTSVNYLSYIDRVIRPVLGGLQLREIQDRVEVLDELYAQLRRCRRLCGGRRGLVDHRPVGQGRRRPDGEPDHECDERCVPHRCRGASASAIHQIHAILHRAFGFGVKWRWMDRNPADLATRPRAARDDSDPPTPQDAARLLEAAEAYRPDLAL